MYVVCSLDICPYLFVHADGFSLRRATRKIRMYARHGAQNLPYLLAGRQLERRTRSDRLFRAVSPRRFATRVQLGGSKFPVLFLQPSIRIQLSSFRNNCYRFPTAMLHFQLFTSKRSPLFRRDLPPLSLSLSLPPPFVLSLSCPRTFASFYSLSLVPLFPFVPTPLLLHRSASPACSSSFAPFLAALCRPLLAAIGVSFSPRAVLLLSRATSSIYLCPPLLLLLLLLSPSLSSPSSITPLAVRVLV